MTIALIDDQILGHVLRGRTPRSLAAKDLFTTGHWYVRLCQAVFRSDQRTGLRSRPFADLSTELRERAVNAVLELPAEIGLISLRDLAPSIASLRERHRLNILGVEALAAAGQLGATVFLSAPSPQLESALRDERLKVTIARAK